MAVIIQAELAGKINNLPHFKSEGLLPVFEAVVNSIQAIEDCPDDGRGNIVVRIQRSSQMSLGNTSESEAPIAGFTIEDDGIGFDEDNYKSFLTSDSTHKIERGCKGVGRFFWLKAFERVVIDSVYTKDGQNRKREISFTKQKGFKEDSHAETDEKRWTKVNLIGYKESYRKLPSSFKTTTKIAQRILEHCLSFYISNSVPKIVVEDNGEIVSLDEMFLAIKEHITSESFSVDKKTFSISHVKLYSTHVAVHDVVFCANGRDVCRSNISKILGTSQQFDEDGKKFIYAAYVSGKYLDKHVRPDRISFDIPTNAPLLAGAQLTLDQIKEASINSIKEFLKDYLVSLLAKKKDVVSEYVANKNPTLRAVAHYCPEVFDEIDPNSSDEKIDSVLYKHKGRAEYEIRQRSQALLKTQASSVEEIEEEYEGITEKLEEFQKDQLAAYVISRKMIIDLLDKKLELSDEGKYQKEDVVHDIIFPRKATTDELDFEDHNLWLIDERMAFHSFATSDNPISKSTNSDSGDRPDIVVFAEVDDDKVARSMSIVELKKPMRDRHEESPVVQMYRYVKQFRDAGEVL